VWRLKTAPNHPIKIVMKRAAFALLLVACADIDPSTTAVPVIADEVVAPPAPQTVPLAPPLVAVPIPLVAATILVSDEWTEAEVPAVLPDAFVLAETDELYLYLYFTGCAEGAHLAYLRYLAPGGAVYQETYIAYAVGETSVESIPVAGLLTPVTVLPSQPTSLGHRVDIYLPIGGTDIQRYGLVGEWTIELDADSSEGPILSMTTVVFE
jgi:hypothetical protein